MAFEEYNHSFRPFIEELQANVVNYNLDALIPRTEEAIANGITHKELIEDLTCCLLNGKVKRKAA